MSQAVATLPAKGKEVAEVTRPSVPQQVAKLLADPYTLDGMPEPGAWRVPAVIPDRKLLENIKNDLTKHMAPAGAEWIKGCLSRLAELTHVKGQHDLSKQEKKQYWKAKAEEYIRLLGKFPPDIWVRCTDQAILKDRFFPQPADLYALMQPELDRRIQAIWRIEQMLKAPEAKAEKPKDPLPVRLRTIIKAFKNSSFMHHRAVLAERELAELEGRPPESWAAGERAA